MNPYKIAFDQLCDEYNILVVELRRARATLDDYSNRVGEVITERHWQALCGQVVDIDVALGDRTREDAYGQKL